MRICVSDLAFFKRITYVVLIDCKDVIVCLLKDYMLEKEILITSFNAADVINGNIHSFIAWLNVKGITASFWSDDKLSNYGLDIPDNCPGYMEYLLKNF